jgi:uncharacterized cysteine cluster protein YcgN (CxxCxxCC family)
MAVERFWSHKTLDELNDVEWEALCDGCGRCCLQKLECEDTKEVFYTDVACKLFNPESCLCNDYSERIEKVADCISLRSLKKDEWRFMPNTCAYRLISEGKALEEWHPLIAGNNKLIIEKGISVRGKIRSELTLGLEGDDLLEHLEDSVVHWVSCD